MHQKEKNGGGDGSGMEEVNRGKKKDLCNKYFLKSDILSFQFLELNCFSSLPLTLLIKSFKYIKKTK